MVSKIRLGPLNSWICWSRRLDTVRRFCTKISVLDLVFIYVSMFIYTSLLCGENPTSNIVKCFFSHSP